MPYRRLSEAEATSRLEHFVMEAVRMVTGQRFSKKRLPNHHIENTAVFDNNGKRIKEYTQSGQRFEQENINEIDRLPRPIRNKEFLTAIRNTGPAKQNLEELDYLLGKHSQSIGEIMDRAWARHRDKIQLNLNNEIQRTASAQQNEVE